MKTTREDARTVDTRADDRPRWWLCVARGRDPSHAGRRVLIDERGALTIGRGAALFGAGVLDDSRISRRHARIEPAGDGLTIRDLGSHNGTRVGGLRIDGERGLADGDVIAIGELLLVVRRAPRSFASRPSVDLEGFGFAHAQIVDALAKVAPRSTTVLLSGEHGVGKGHLAAAIHRRSGRGGPLVTVECGVFRGDLAFRRLFGGDGAGCLAQARGGTLFLDGIDEADPDFQRCALAALDRCEGGDDIRVLASTCVELDPGGPVRVDLAARLARWVIRLAPLRSRQEDIPALARALAQRFAGRPVELHRRLVHALLLHDWPGNVRELAAAIERAVVEGGERPPLRLSPGVRRLLGLGEAARPDGFAIAASGTWFRPPNGERVELAHRPTLARLLRALAERARAGSGAPLSPGELLEEGWPGEQVLEGAGANRVHVALTTLRKLGLRSALLRDRRGYILDPTSPLRVVDE